MSAIQPPLRLPADADIDRVAIALGDALNELERVARGLVALEAADGRDFDLVPIEHEHISALATIRRDVENRVADFERLAATLERDLQTAISLRAEQRYQAERRRAA